MSFHQKSAWACLVSTLAVYIPYFVLAFQNPVAYVGLFIAAVMVQTAILIGLHITFAISTRGVLKSRNVPPPDELEIKIERYAAKTSGLALGVVVIIWCIGVFIAIPVAALHDVVTTSSGSYAESFGAVTIPAIHALTAAQILFAGFVLANVVYYTRIVVGYRGAN